MFKNLTRTSWLSGLALLMALGLPGCGKKEDAQVRQATTTETPDATDDKAPAERSYLAYEHSLVLDLPEAGIAPLAARARQRCERDRENHCVLLDARLDLVDHGTSAELRFRAAPAGIQALIQDLGSQGDVASQRTHAEDLTRPVQDVGKKLAMLRSYEGRLEALKVSAARDVESLIKIH